MDLCSSSSREAREAGQMWASYRTSHAIIPSRPITSPLSREGTSRPLTHLTSLSLPIPFRHIGPCPVACSALPCPCVPEFPLSRPIAQAQFAHLSPDLRHGASQALKATTPRCSDSCSTAHKRFALPSSLAVPRPNRIFPRDLEQGCSTLHSWPSGKPFAPL